ncbi:MAG: NAD(P)H-binding protein [Acidimicrobiaceae bacterium]|nr:NAD(P)H-binding protein [Acidimicrobiaceae bacterium]MYG54605.1 NAD(P)H-binding protein [Acidimicrobiaceae bacterium]MYJ98155.1 NAD(P)H-binding protein [Acidimicrobiaceae bacterium]
MMPPEEAVAADMRVIVFGTTSRLGRQVWREALDAGHDVTVFGRSATRLSEEEPALKPIQGDLIDAGAVAGAVAHHDAVMICLGSDHKEEHAQPATSTNIIVNAMVSNGVRRLVVATTTGEGLYTDKIPIIERTMRRVLPRFTAWIGPSDGTFGGFDSPRIRGGHAPREDIIKDSPLDWTIVRAPVINDTPPRGWAERAANVNREDVAGFMVQQLTDLANNHRTITARDSKDALSTSEPVGAEPPAKGKFDDYPLDSTGEPEKRRRRRSRTP